MFYEIIRVSPFGEKNGWIHIRTSGSHYIYEKEGKRYPVPFMHPKKYQPEHRKRWQKKWE